MSASIMLLLWYKGCVVLPSQTFTSHPHMADVFYNTISEIRLSACAKYLQNPHPEVGILQCDSKFRLL